MRKRGRFPHSIAGEPFLAGFEEVFGPAIVKVLVDTFLAAQLGNRLLATLALLMADLVVAGPYDGEIPGRGDRYVYMATVTRVIDDDTIVADVDLGFGTWRHGERRRLARIDTPEGGAGAVAGSWLRRRIEGKKILIRTLKDRRGKYRRYLVELFQGGKNINDELVKQGLAVYWGKD